MGLIDDIKKLSPEERAEMRAMLEMQEEAADDEKLSASRKKNPPASPKAERVYFFKQLLRLHIDEIKKSGDKLQKKATQLPDRVIAVDEKQAAKLYWKGQGKYQYLGRSEGRTWREERMNGKSVAEAQALEYQAMLEAPDMNIPPNRDKIFFAGTKPAMVARGVEIGWADGLKQQGNS